MASGNYGKSWVLAESRRRRTGQNSTAPEQPLPTELAKLKLNVLRERQAWGRARRSSGGRLKSLLALAKWLLARLNAFRPVRVWQHYTLRHGPLMSAGIGFNMFFSILGLLATGFSIAGLVLAEQPELVDRVVHGVAQSAPGLLKVDGKDGLADPTALLNPAGLGLTAVVAAVVTVFTSLGWITSLRSGLRGILGLPPLKVNAIAQRLRDVGTLVLLGVALVLTSAVSLVFTAALGFIAGLLHLDRAIVEPIGWLIGVVVPLLLNWLTAFIMFRLAGSLRLGRRAMVEGTFIAGLGTSILQIFSSQLLARAGANPLLAPFAIIIGLLIWFNLVSQVYLASASWSAIREADAAVPDRRPMAGFRNARPGRRPSRALAAARPGSGLAPSARPAPVATPEDDGGTRPADDAQPPAVVPSPTPDGETATPGGELKRPRRRPRREPWHLEMLRAIGVIGARG
ncbi:YihY/virulence factor BrkB family protein [Sinomonas sp. ASV322]|uniref:YihY/virulence factor BrkB family protein n=1 Tax=Sinomonas sp. ASV322 TaxID=3041920 RepID=UPI0027DAE4DC|nr:YihY/virulence factor BrkB family protein [Sinomonas sp. ASV322]MDQ4503622.1 YihY/virulence factor BrkB family protein [Sinomonas sp. ASV322]